MINIELATPDELLQLVRQAEEEQDGKLYKQVMAEIRRRIKYDY